MGEAATHVSCGLNSDSELVRTGRKSVKLMALAHFLASAPSSAGNTCPSEPAVLQVRADQADSPVHSDSGEFVPYSQTVRVVDAVRSVGLGRPGCFGSALLTVRR